MVESFPSSRKTALQREMFLGPHSLQRALLLAQTFKEMPHGSSPLSVFSPVFLLCRLCGHSKYPHQDQVINPDRAGLAAFPSTLALSDLSRPCLSPPHPKLLILTHTSLPAVRLQPESFLHSLSWPLRDSLFSEYNQPFPLASCTLDYPWLGLHPHLAVCQTSLKFLFPASQF